MLCIGFLLEFIVLWQDSTLFFQYNWNEFYEAEETHHASEANPF